MRSGTSDFLRRIQIGAQSAQPLAVPQQRILRPEDQIQPVPPSRDDDVDLYWWRDHGVEVDARPGGYAPVDDQLFKVPTGEHIPESIDPKVPVWVTGTQPQWNEPSFWSIPFSRTCEICIPTWEQEYRLCTLRAGEMEMMVIRSISYHVISGLNQYDLFEMKAYQGPALRSTWEDMIIDPTSANPSERYIFAGDTRPLPLYMKVDRNKTAGFSVKARGLVDLSGGSNHSPGDALIPNAHFRINIEGWITPLRRNVDGAPRPVDMGNMLFVPMDPDLRLEGR